MVTVSDVKEKEKQNTPATGIVVVDFREMAKGESLRGFVTLQLPSGLRLYDCTLHQRGNGARWIGMPARSYTDKDGKTSWQRMVDFADRPRHERFQQAALAAVDEYFAGPNKKAVR